MGSARPPHRDAGGLQLLLESADRRDSEMEDRGGQSGIGAPEPKYLDEMFDGAGAPRSNHGDGDGSRDCTGHVAIETIASAIAVYRGEQYLPGSPLLCLRRPGHGVASGSVPASRGFHSEGWIL